MIGAWCGLYSNSLEQQSTFTKFQQVNFEWNDFPIRLATIPALPQIRHISVFIELRDVAGLSLSPKSGSGAFAYFDATAQAVTSQRESMQVAWYSSGGALDREAWQTRPPLC